MSTMKRILVILTVLLSLVTSRAKAQDVSYSQTYEAPLYVSPSFTGLTNGTRIGLNFRNQWPGIGNAFQNYALSVDNFFEEFNSGFGFMWQCDNQGKGLLVDNEMSILYAYEFTINQDIFIRPGLSFKFGQRKIDQSKMVSFTDITADGHFTTGGSSMEIERTHKSRIDASTSVMAYNDDFWVGIAFDHLVQPNVSFTDSKQEIKMKTTFYAGYRFTYEPSYRGSEPKTVTLAMNYKHQYSYNQLELGAFWYYAPIEIGLSYRGLFFKVAEEISNRDAFIPTIGVNVGPLRVGYSYDMSISDLSSFGNGAHEISAIYRIIPPNVKKRNYKMKPVPCSEPIMGYSYNAKGAKKHIKRKGLRK